MRKILQLGAGVALVVAVLPGAYAQRRTAQAPIVVSAPAGTRVIQVQPQSGQTSNASPGTVVVGTTAGSAETLLNGGLPAPGLGFDFAHQAAVNSNADVRALIDPITQHRLALARQIRRETPVAPLVLPLVFNSTQIILQQSPPVIILQQLPAPLEPVERIERVRYVEPERAPAQASPAAPPEPPRDVGEFVLVRMDGSLVFAVAFSASRERIVYITREGLRRSFPLAELDIEATLQMNDARGATLRLPV